MNRATLVRILAPLSLLVSLVACVGSLPPTRRINSALDYLYPQGMAAARPAQQVTLRLPLRVGLAFAPNRAAAPEPVTEEEKQRLLARVADAFREHRGLGRLEVIPSTYLQPGGGFANLDQLRASLGLDAVVLLSYDQAQFTEATRASWTYLTVVGTLLIDGEKNETRTVIDAVVYDIPSRALLFRAAGESSAKARSGPFTVDRKRRRLASEGFARATDDLIADLESALAAFEQQARAGTVQGPGTPAVAMYDARGERVGPGQSGGGALGRADLVLALASLLLLETARRRWGPLVAGDRRPPDR
jgi:rhombotail lipoprotein